MAYNLSSLYVKYCHLYENKSRNILLIVLLKYLKQNKTDRKNKEVELFVFFTKINGDRMQTQ